MAKHNITPPDLNECKSYEAYKRELRAWSAVTDLAKSKQGNYIALSLPNKSKFGNDLREKVFESLSETVLVSDTGLTALIEFLDGELGKNAVDDIIEKWDEFENCRKKENQTLEDFLSDFEMKYNRVKSSGTNLPEEVLAFMLMKRAGLTQLEKMLILSRIDLEKKDQLFKAVKLNMTNFLGKRVKEGTSNDLKLEPTFLAQHEDCLAAAGYFRGRAQTMPFKGKSKPYQSQGNKGFHGNNNKQAQSRNVNPPGKEGKPLLCSACGSYRHLIKQCPDSYENRPKGTYVAEEIDDNAQMEKDVQRFVLFTSDNDEMSTFTSEALNCAALDTCCTTSVAGNKWLNIYMR